MTPRKKIRIHFSQVDAAGILFFGRAFELAHDAFEDWLKDQGVEWAAWFQNPKWIAPLRHVEADFHRPLRGGEDYELELKILELKECSFTVSCRFFQGETLHAELRHVHVFVDAKAGAKIPIPPQVRGVLDLTHSD